MSARREKWAKFIVKENEAVAAFLKALNKQKDSFNKSEFTRRSWVKDTGAGYSVQLGKIGSLYHIEKKEDVNGLLDDVAADARDDAELIAEIEAAYGKTGDAPAKRGRKPKAA